jgi:subtilisin family serine protease
VLVVAAAGNEGLNSDFFHFYPADYEFDNILSVGAVDRDGEPLALSNYGVRTVDLAAPGKNIYSTLPNGQYGFMTGTSQATAFVTAAAALVLTQKPQAPQELIHTLLASGNEIPSWKGRSRSGSILNAQAAMQNKNRAPARTAATE